MSNTLPDPNPNEPLGKQARALEQNKQFEQALDLYRQQYEQDRTDTFTASGYLRCLRKVGKAKEAIELGRELASNIRENQHVHNAIAWAIYDFYFKRVENETEDDFDNTVTETSTPDFNDMTKAANYVLKKSPDTDTLIRTKIVFGVCSQAKSAGKWQVMYDFATRLNPDQLSKEAGMWNERQMMSDYQRWLYIMSKALFKLEQYEECLNIAQQGVVFFPGEKFFPRQQALAKKEIGLIEEALGELQSLNKRFQEWYIQCDIAALSELTQQDQQAWLWYCKAASLPGKFDGRYKMFTAMSALLQRLERWQEAYAHLRLAYLIAEDNRWTRPAESIQTQLTEFEKQYGGQLHLNTIPDDFRTISNKLRTLWRQEISAARPHCTGTIKTINERSGFIKTDNSDYFFSLRDVPRHLVLEVGMEIEFELEESYDQKKQRESFKAVHIRLLRH